MGCSEVIFITLLVNGEEWPDIYVLRVHFETRSIKSVLKDKFFFTCVEFNFIFYLLYSH